MSDVLLVSEVRQRRDNILENMELITERNWCTVSERSKSLLRYRQIILCAQKDVSEFLFVKLGDKPLCPRYRKPPSRAADSPVWMCKEGHTEDGCS